MKNFIMSIGIATTLLLCGCGNDNNRTQEEKVNNLPQEINTNKLIVLTNPKVDENESLQRYGHHTLQNHLESVEATQKLLEINLLMAEKLMKDIRSHCERTNVGEFCDIEEGILSLILDDELIDEMSKVVGESLDDEELAKKGEEIPFGRMTYIEYDKTEVHQYNLLMDTTIQEKFLGSEGVDSAAEIKWSEDKRQVFSFYSFNDGNLTNTLSLDLNKSDTNVSRVLIENKITDNQNKVYNDGYFAFYEHNNEGLKLYGSMITNDSDYNLSSDIYLSGNLLVENPALNYVGKINDIRFEEHVTFDNKSSIISSRFCNENLECVLHDETTWFRPEDKKNDELLYDVPSAVSAYGYSPTELKIKFRVNADTGTYYLFRPGTNFSYLSTHSHLKNSALLSFTISKDGVSEVFGKSSSYLYESELDDLLVWHFKLDSEKRYRELTGFYRPKISLAKEISVKVSAASNGILKSGRYYIFKPDEDLRVLNIPGIPDMLLNHLLSRSVGGFDIHKEGVSEVIEFSEAYNDKLNDLTIVYIDENVEVNKYQILSQEQRPMLDVK
jgi:hypothetical protein